MEIKNFPCPVCDKNDYHDCGDMHPDKTLVICKECGAVWHKRDNSTEESLLDFYRKDYRDQPDHKNLVFSQNKLNYLAAFLHDYLEGKEPMKCTDIGCATGYLPNFLRRLGHKATGTEYTTTYRRFAEHFYGIPTTERIEKKHKYGLISFYHTLEHMFSPDEKLREARECLDEGGKILVAVPRFLDIYDDPSTINIVPFEKLFHKNHINLFTLRAIENLFAKVGLRVVKENLVTYGMTFLLEKCEPTNITPEDWQANLAEIEKQKRAWELCAAGKHKDALDFYPKMPNAWIHFITQTIGKDPVRQADEWAKCLAIPELADNAKVLMAYCFWLQQNEKYPEAIDAWTRLIDIKPNADWFFQRGVCQTIAKRHKDALGSFRMAANMQPLRWAECMDWAAKNVCAMPTWEEVGIEHIKEELYKANKANISFGPKDAVMNGTEKE